MFGRLSRCMQREPVLKWVGTGQATEHFVRSLSNNAALITRPHRAIYERTYPVLVVDSDGSSYNIRYHVPRQIIRLPLDVTKLSEEERLLRLENRKPKRKVVYVVEEKIDFQASKYLKMIKKKK